MAELDTSIEAQYQCEDGERYSTLERMRQCARLTIPTLLPDRNKTPDDPLPSNFTSTGSNAIMSVVGNLLMDVFAPDRPWIMQEMAPEMRQDPRIPAEFKEQVAAALFAQDVALQSIIVSSDSDFEDNAPAVGFYSASLANLKRLVVCGDTLQRMDENFRTRGYRNDKYVTKRDSSGAVLHHIVTEKMVVRSVPEEHRAKLDLTRYAGLAPWKQEIDRYVRVEWQPYTRKWVETTEYQKKEVETVEHVYTPYFSAFFELCEGDNYGTGLAELNRGDLWSDDNFTRRMADWAGAASKLTPVIDDLCDNDEEDLEQESGVPIRTTVSDGRATKIGFLSVDKIADYRVVQEFLAGLRERINRNFLSQSQSIRASERTTAAEVDVTVRENAGGRAGIYAPVSDQLVIPLMRRAMWQMKKQGLMPIAPRGMVKTTLLTGVAALAALGRAQQILEYAQVVQALGPQAMARINEGVMLSVLARYRRISEPGLIKTDEQLAREQQAAIAAQTQLAAGEAGAKAAGAIATAQLSPR